MGDFRVVSATQRVTFSLIKSKIKKEMDGGIGDTSRNINCIIKNGSLCDVA